MSDEKPVIANGGAVPVPAPAAAAPAPAPGPETNLEDAVIDRARARMRTTARVLGLTSIGVLGVVVVVGGAIGSLTGFVDRILDPLVLVLGIGSPLLAVIALNILVWRALVPGLARLAPSSRVVAIIGIGVAIAGVSVILLAGLLWVGVIAILLLEGFS